MKGRRDGGSKGTMQAQGEEFRDLTLKYTVMDYEKENQ